MGLTTEVTVLLVDDDEIDRESVIRGFKVHKVLNPLIEAENGQEALEILRGTHSSKKLEKPYLVLLDINMPIMNGDECLKEIRNDPTLTDAIVFILTTSNADEDKAKAYRMHVNGYMTKSNAGDDFVKLVQMLDGYWRIVEFP